MPHSMPARQSAGGRLYVERIRRTALTQGVVRQGITTDLITLPRQLGSMPNTFNLFVRTMDDRNTDLECRYSR